MKIKYKVIRKLTRFYSEEVYFQIYHCDTWEEVCNIIDPLYIITKKEPIPINHYTHPDYGETWIFRNHEVGFSSCPDTVSYTVCVDKAGIW